MQLAATTWRSRATSSKGEPFHAAVACSTTSDYTARPREFRPSTPSSPAPPPPPSLLWPTHVSSHPGAPTEVAAPTAPTVPSSTSTCWPPPSARPPLTRVCKQSICGRLAIMPLRRIALPPPVLAFIFFLFFERWQTTHPCGHSHSEDGGGVRGVPEAAARVRFRGRETILRVGAGSGDPSGSPPSPMVMVATELWAPGGAPAAEQCSVDFACFTD